MSMDRLSLAFVPLVDAAPVILAQEMGFAAAEGVQLDLVPAPSWSSVRDMLVFGRVEAAHLLSAMPVAMAMGLGGVTTPVSAVSVLSVNGNTIGINRTLAAQLKSDAYVFGFDDPVDTAEALAARCDQLVIGVPFLFSMHALLLRYWINGTALRDLPITIRTVPPPMMAQALEAGEIDAFCVGEPWGSVIVDAGLGALLLPGQAIWRQAPEKVLAVRTGWADSEPELLGRLMRAVWQAGRWLAEPESHTMAAQVLSRSEHLDLSPELIDRALTGHLILTQRGDQAVTEGFLRFHKTLASFPWRSQAKWIAQELANAHLDGQGGRAMEAGAACFRSDLYRQHLAGLADMPGASEKLEGAIRQPLHVGTSSGGQVLLPDGFFDRRIFDPAPRKR